MGYLHEAGFDGNEECSTPNKFNIHTTISEYLKITILPVLGDS